MTADPSLLVMGTAALGLLAVVAIILVAQMQRQARRHRTQLARLVRMLEQSLPPNPPLPVEMPELDEELAALIPSISQLLALRDDQNQNRYQLLKELAHGLNHNMNNLLFGILGATQLIERHSDDDEVRSWAKVAHSDGQKLTNLVKQLTEAVTEHVDQTPDNLKLSSIISNLLNQQQPRWLEQAITAGQRIDFQVELAEPCRAIRANPGGITSMLEQLIRNSVDALTNGGTVTIRTFQPNPLEVSIEVSDDGIGMNGNTRRRIFDPFFTTKKTLGTGLGLSKVMTTVLQWDGMVAVTSEPGKGTSFVVTFPAVDPADITENREDRTALHAQVLVVDDQRAIGQVISQSLDDNYEVTIFEDAESAIRAFQPGRWDVAIIDLDLPGISGDQLARRMREHDPQISRILMTGWALETTDPRRQAFEYYLQKPVTDIDLLNQLVAKALRKPMGHTN